MSAWGPGQNCKVGVGDSSLGMAVWGVERAKVVTENEESWGQANRVTLPSSRANEGHGKGERLTGVG